MIEKSDNIINNTFRDSKILKNADELFLSRKNDVYSDSDKTYQISNEYNVPLIKKSLIMRTDNDRLKAFKIFFMHVISDKIDHENMDLDGKYQNNSDELFLEGLNIFNRIGYNHFDNASELDSNEIFPILCKASALSDLQHYKKADEYFKIAEKIDCDNLLFLVEMGKHLMNQNNFLKSIEYFDRYLKIDEDIAVVWMYKSMALSEIGRDEESEKCFNKAIELDPDSISLFDEVILIEE